MPSAVETQNQYSIPVSEALNIADAFMSNIEGETRATRMVSKIEVKTSSKTRSLTNGADTLLYLINYSDNAGFALVSADRRLPAIYAISDEGHFEFADTLQNPGLSFFMKTVDNSISYSMDNWSDVIIPDSVNWNKGYYDQFKNVYDMYTPKLKPAMSKISQNYPFNNYCFWKGKKKVAGCAPVGVATLMSFFQWPESYKGYEIPWDEIREVENNLAMAKVIYMLWGPENLNVYPQYENNVFIGMAAATSRLVPTLQNMGYIVQDGLKSFDSDEVIEVLRRGIDTPAAGTPVLARGTTKVNNKPVGHVWVIDGAMWQHGRIGDGTVDPGIGWTPQFRPNMPMTLFHCVWGWGGAHNGFFNFDANVLGGNPDFLGENDEASESSSYVFDTQLQYIGYIKRNK
ncbi:MAG: C10 family peptidase [Muribaculaceae bacterium]|nr:C10 family peptidase [Muribaculaceae bacterium]